MKHGLLRLMGWAHTAVGLLFVVVLAVTWDAAHAGPIVYRGMNPSISPSANPFNGSNIQVQAALTQPERDSSSAFSRRSEADLLKQSVLNGLSATYRSLLTGSESTSGTLTFGDGSYANYETVGNTRVVTFYDLNGTPTEIAFPLGE